MLQMTLLMGYIEGKKLLETPGAIYTKPLVGRVWKVLDMLRDVHIYLHYGGRHEKSSRLPREFQRSLVYSYTFLYIALYIELSRIL